MNKQTKKQLAMIASISFLFILFLSVWSNYRQPTISHATSTIEQSNGREIEWFFELERNTQTGKYEATHIYTEDTDLDGVLHLPHTLNGYPVTSIGRGIEKNPVIPAECTVTEITIPDTVTTYEDYSFYQLSHLQKVYRVQTKVQSGLEPTYTPYLNLLDSEILKTVGYQAFMGCSSLDCMYVPNRSLEVKDAAFADCTGLKTVYVGQGAWLHDYVFKDCTNLTHLEIDQEQIGNQFQDCTNLESIVFGKNVMRISSDAFRTTRQNPKILSAGCASQQYIYYNNELDFEGSYDSQTAGKRQLYFLNPDTVIQHQIYANCEDQSFKIEHIGMLFPEFIQQFSGTGTGSETVSIYYNYDLIKQNYQTFTSQIPKIYALKVKENTSGQNITDFYVTSDSVTATENERIQYTWSNNLGEQIRKNCYPTYSFTQQECLNIYDFYQNGIATNYIYITADATKTSEKVYSEETKITTYSIVPEEGSTFLENTDLQNWWHDYCKTQKIDAHSVPSYLCESQNLQANSAGEVRYITARYVGSVQENQLLKPDQLKIDIYTQALSNSFRLDGNDSRIFYIKKEDLKRESTKDSRLFAETDMDYYDAYSESQLGFLQDCFDYRYYDYSKWQRFFHVADVATEEQLFFSEDSKNQILSIPGMNDVHADTLVNDAVEGYTDIYLFYIAGFRKIGIGGTYEKENSKYILASTQEDMFGDPKQEGLFDQDHEYVGVGGSFRWDEEKNAYIYDVTGEYAPIIYKTSCRIYTTPQDQLQIQNYEDQIQTLNAQLAALNSSYQQLTSQVELCDQAFDQLSQVLGGGYSESTQLTLEQKSTALIAKSASVRQDLADYQQSLLEIATNLNALAKNVQSEEQILDSDQQELSPDQAMELIAKMNQMVMETGDKFEQLNDKIAETDASIQLVNGIIEALNLAEKSSNEQVLNAVIKLYKQNQENEKLLDDQTTDIGSIAFLQEKVASLSTAKSSLEQQIRLEQSKAASLSSQNQTLQESMSMLQQRNQTLQADVSTLQQKNLTLTEQISRLESENQNLKQKLENEATTQPTKQTVTPRTSDSSKQTDPKTGATTGTKTGTKTGTRTGTSTITSAGTLKSTLIATKKDITESQNTSSDTTQPLTVKKNMLPVSYRSNSIRQLTTETSKVVESQTTKSSAAIKRNQNIPQNRMAKTSSKAAVTPEVSFQQPVLKQEVVQNDAYSKKISKSTDWDKIRIYIVSTAILAALGIITVICLKRRSRKSKNTSAFFLD